MKRSNKTETFTAPDESGTLRMTARTTIVDIARQTYDDLEAAILVVRVEGSISGDGVDPDEWAVFTNDLTGQEFSLLYGEGTLVQIDEDEQHVELTGHKSLYAVLQNDEWKIYERVPYFPDAETENDFMLKRDSLMSYYKQAIR